MSQRTRYLEGQLVRRADIDNDRLYLEEAAARHESEFHSAGKTLSAAVIQAPDATARLVMERRHLENSAWAPAELRLETKTHTGAPDTALSLRSAEASVSGLLSADAAIVPGTVIEEDEGGGTSARPAGIDWLPSTSSGPDSTPGIRRMPGASGLRWNMGLPGPQGDRTVKLEIGPAAAPEGNGAGPSSFLPALTIAADGHVRFHAKPSPPIDPNNPSTLKPPAGVQIKGKLRFGPVPLDPTNRHFQLILSAARAAAHGQYSVEDKKVAVTIDATAKVPIGRPFDATVQVDHQSSPIRWISLRIDDQIPYSSSVEDGLKKPYRLPFRVPAQLQAGTISLVGLASGAGLNGRWRATTANPTIVEFVPAPSVALLPAAIPPGVIAKGVKVKFTVGGWKSWKDLKIAGGTVSSDKPDELDVPVSLQAGDTVLVEGSFALSANDVPWSLDQTLTMGAQAVPHVTVASTGRRIEITNNSGTALTDVSIDAASFEGGSAPQLFNPSTGLPTNTLGTTTATRKAVLSATYAFTGMVTVKFSLVYTREGITYTTALNVVSLDSDFTYVVSGSALEITNASGSPLNTIVIDEFQGGTSPKLVRTDGTPTDSLGTGSATKKALLSGTYATSGPVPVKFRLTYTRQAVIFHTSLESATISAP